MAKMNPKEFINTYMPLLLEIQARTGVPAALSIGQAALESGWGENAPENNFHGIKGTGPAGTQLLWTKEVINGKKVRVQDWFKKYNTPQESFEDHAKLISENPRYAKVMEAAKAGDIDRVIEETRKAGYATEEPQKYVNDIKSIVKNNGLNKPEYILTNAKTQPLTPETASKFEPESREQMSAQLRQPVEAQTPAQRALGRQEGVQPTPEPTPQSPRLPMTTEQYRAQYPLKEGEEMPQRGKGGELLVTQTFGNNPRYYSGTGLTHGHEGLDFRMQVGTPVYNTMNPATVEFIGTEQDFPNTYGNFVLLKGPENDAMLLAHFDSVNVKQGQTIKGGELIGNSGASGAKLNGVSQPHLHAGYGKDFEKINRNVQNFAQTKRWIDPSGGFDDPTEVFTSEYSKKFVDQASPAPFTEMNKQIVEATGSAGIKTSPITEAVEAVGGFAKNMAKMPGKAIENRIGAVKNMASSLFGRKEMPKQAMSPSPLASYRAPQATPRMIGPVPFIGPLPQYTRPKTAQAKAPTPGNVSAQTRALVMGGPISTAMQRTIPATFSAQPASQTNKVPTPQVALNNSQFGMNQMASYRQPSMNYNMFRTPPPQPAPTQSFNTTSAQSFSQPSYSAPAQSWSGGGGGGSSWTVQSGQTLSGIAQSLLGDAGRYRELTGYSSGNPNLIYPGEQIRVA